MEKSLYHLRINPEFHNLIPPLTEEERKMLEDSIVRDGCDTPLIVWKGTIVDGHNRYEICHKHSIPFSIEERDFEDKDAAMLWMLERQLGRRNLNSFQRGELALRAKEHLAKAAKERMLAGVAPGPNLAQGSRVSEQLAKMAGVGRETMKKVEKIDSEADDVIKDQLRKGKISIHKAYTGIKAKEHEGEMRVCESCGKEKPFTEFEPPSNCSNYRPICKECEAKAKEEATRAADPSITGIDVKNGQVVHTLVGLPNNPDAFEQLVDMLQNTLDYYISSFQGLINQYQSRMMTDGNTHRLQSMISKTNKAITNLLNERIKEAL
ncbi:MAG: hypothetical protein IJ708_06885 [Clostridia bacterium]|nr:hypothetical protein [Clostridia bacterium]